MIFFFLGGVRIIPHIKSESMQILRIWDLKTSSDAHFFVINKDNLLKFSARSFLLCEYFNFDFYALKVVFIRSWPK